MNPTHIGSTPKGRRVHLCDSKGWSACSRRLIDISPIEEVTVKDGDPWCGRCVTRLADDAVLSARIAFGRREREHPSARRIGASVKALEIAVEALVEIAKLGDATAGDLALEAARKIQATLPQRDGA